GCSGGGVLASHAGQGCIRAERRVWCSSSSFVLGDVAGSSGGGGPSGAGSDDRPGTTRRYRRRRGSTEGPKPARRARGRRPRRRTWIVGPECIRLTRDGTREQQRSRQQRHAPLGG